MAERTVLNFETDNDIWPTVESWSKETGYKEIAKGDTWRRYQKGHGMIAAPKKVEVRQEDKEAQLQAWVNFNLIARIGTLFLIPSEIDVGSGFRGKFPRSQARNDVNILLQRLGQPLIE